MKKIEKLREHYFTTDNGKTWKPKVGFNTDEEIKQEGLWSNKWRRYDCSFCGKVHVAKANRNKNDYE